MAGQFAWLAGDPHLGLAHGGKADMRGEDGMFLPRDPNSPLFFPACIPRPYPHSEVPSC